MATKKKTAKRNPGTPRPADVQHIATGLRDLAVPMSKLTPDPANARTHSDRNMETIRASLQTFGQQKPIVVQKKGMVVRAGNGTLAAATQLGWKFIAANVVDMTPAEAIAYAIADNRTAELAAWDQDALQDLIRELPEDMAKATGFTEKDLERMSGGTTGDGDTGASQLGAVEFRVIVDCQDEQHQAELIEFLEQKGEKCRPLMS